MFGDRFSSSTSCSRWVHETEPDRPDQSLTCCFLKVATHPSRVFPCIQSYKRMRATNDAHRRAQPRQSEVRKWDIAGLSTLSVFNRKNPLLKINILLFDGALLTCANRPHRF